jgi:hypothetical protein
VLRPRAQWGLTGIVEAPGVCSPTMKAQISLPLLLAAGLAAAQSSPDLRRSELQGPPSDQIVRRDIDGDGKPDLVERWWNGKRVRWLDENGDLKPTDTRGDHVGDVLQVDMNGDGLYDGVTDQSIKWADNDGDGRADVQAWSTQPPVWGEGDKWSTAESHWMLFLDVEKDGVLGWQDWRRFDFGESNWAHTGLANWKPDYHGDALFLKIHRPPQALPDPRLNWENPFAFYDTDKDGLTEMAMRWLDPMTPVEKGVSPLSGVLNEAFLTFDLDNDSSKGNEIDYDMTLRGSGGPGVRYLSMGASYPALRGNPKFDRCFQWGNWRQVGDLLFMPHEKGFDAFFAAGWKTMYLVYDEDDDDHRWERVEMYYPMHGFGGAEEIDPWTTKRWRNGNYARYEMADEGQKPGLGGHPQADSLGDRGEFDRDNSGGGRLYVGVFDRKLHLAGAEWGAWTVDRRGEYHGGWKTPSPKPSAPKVEEVVRYSDRDANGFLDTVEYDYDGDRTIDFRVSLLDYKTAGGAAPDAAPLIDTAAAGWQGLHDAYTRLANQSWQEALAVYRAAWKRGLTTSEMDKLANAASVAERHANAYWIKERAFREIRGRIREIRSAEPARGPAAAALEADLTRLYYLGKFDEYVARIGDVPGR